MPEPPEKFNAIVEGGLASLSILRGFSVFLQFAGPWALLLLGLFAALIPMAGDNLGPAINAPLFLMDALLLLPTIVLSAPSVAVAWVRWTVAGDRPRWLLALPDQMAYIVIWKLWLFSAAAAVLESACVHGVDRLAAAAKFPYATTFDVVIEVGVSILVVVLVSSRALLLTATAAGDRAFTPAMAREAAWAMWPKLPLGLVVAMAPFFLLRLSIGEIFGPWAFADGHTLFDPPVFGLVAMNYFLGLASVASAAAFLSKAYMAVSGPGTIR